MLQHTQSNQIYNYSTVHRSHRGEAKAVDRVIDIDQTEAEDVMRRLAREEGIFAGVSSGGAIAAALQLNREVENATIVAIVCDRGDRYLSTGVYTDPLV